MTLRAIRVLCCAGLLAAGPLAADEPELAETMGQMQRFLHKLSLSVAADNPELADFYAHELEETIETAEAIEEYDGQPVGALVSSMLAPSFEQLESALDGDDAGATGERLEQVINACNACHQATGFGFIRIGAGEHNPYMQSFEPRK